VPDPSAFYQIVQTPSHVVLFLEAVHEARIISLDGRPHLPPSVRLWEGDSRGRWEGETLVVDTTNFSAHNNFMGFVRSAAPRRTLHARRGQPDRLPDHHRRSDHVDQPWTAVIRLKQSAERLFEYACHEGNFEILRGMFAGARANDKDR
jgi:hypothetical protein